MPSLAIKRRLCSREHTVCEAGAVVWALRLTLAKGQNAYWVHIFCVGMIVMSIRAYT